MQGCPAHANAVKALAAHAPMYSTIAFADFSQVLDWPFGWAQRIPDGMHARCLCILAMAAGNFVKPWLGKWIALLFD